MKNPLALSAALALALAVAVAGGLWWSMRGGDLPPAFSTAAIEQEAGATEAQLAMVPDMVLGNPDAAATLIEYASFTCPHCKNFHANVFDQLKADYIDTGKIKFVYREVYFDRFGLWAGLVARCGGAERYFGIADLLYEGQADWIGDGAPATVAANLRKIGLTAGMGAEEIEVCLNDGTQAEAMVAAFQKYAGEDEINSTPSFVINGTKHSNMDYAEMKALLDAALAQ